MPFKPFSKPIAPVIDNWPELCSVPHTQELVRRKIEYLASFGSVRKMC